MKILPHYPTVPPQYIQILGINFQQNFPTDMMLKTICKSPEKQETEEPNYFCLNLSITKRVYNNYFTIINFTIIILYYYTYRVQRKSFLELAIRAS